MGRRASASGYHAKSKRDAYNLFRNSPRNLARNLARAALATTYRLVDTAVVNFLAHLVLGPQTPQGLVGSIAPDMIRGPLPRDLEPSVARAALEHQRIDRFTDAHRAFLATRDRVRSCVHPRLAGVLTDVLYDHVLASAWSHWRDDTLACFVASAEDALLSHGHLVPQRMRMIIRKMVDEQWLMSYASADGIRARLVTMSSRLTQRMGRPMDLVISHRDLERVYPAIEADFRILWPDLKACVAEHRRDLSTRLAS